MRNSSLVECASTDNVSRLKPLTEAVDDVNDVMVGERSGGREARPRGLVEQPEVRMPE